MSPTIGRRLFARRRAKNLSRNVGEEMMTEKMKLEPGQTLLVIAKDGEVLHYSWDMSLPHVEFVRRKTGELPPGAWVGTITKDRKGIVVISSKTFYGYQLPAPEWVADAVKKLFC